MNVINGKSVFIDTAPFVYFVEEREPYADLLAPFFEAVDAGKLYSITSTITCSEALVIPCRQKNWYLVEKYEMLLIETPSLTIAPFNLGLARQTAEIRAKYGLKTPDAIQWATATQYGAKFFLTNDQGFKRFSSPEVLLIEDYV
ncbi:MAG: type II toxin-antitoxin system VapC family toxin [Planctomycetaceae bacterium]|nr:type II toxin-antitoxin system VapC family toxin [Planctomycetaceae bacterium]